MFNEANQYLWTTSSSMLEKKNISHFINQISWCPMIWSKGILRGIWKFRVSQIGGSVPCALRYIVLEHIWIWCLCSDVIFVIRGFILLNCEMRWKSFEKWRISRNASSWVTCCHHRLFDLDHFVRFHLIWSCQLSCHGLSAEYSVTCFDPGYFRSVPKICISFHSLFCNVVSIAELSFLPDLWIWGECGTDLSSE